MQWHPACCCVVLVAHQTNNLCDRKFHSILLKFYYSIAWRCKTKLKFENSQLKAAESRQWQRAPPRFKLNSQLNAQTCFTDTQIYAKPQVGEMCGAATASNTEQPPRYSGQRQAARKAPNERAARHRQIRNAFNELKKYACAPTSRCNRLSCIAWSPGRLAGTTQLPAGVT